MVQVQQGELMNCDLTDHIPNGRRIDGWKHEGHKVSALPNDIAALLTDARKTFVTKGLGAKSAITDMQFIKFLILHLLQNRPTKLWAREQLKKMEEEMHIKRSRKKKRENSDDRLWEEAVSAGFNEIYKYKNFLSERRIKFGAELQRKCDSKQLLAEDIGALDDRYFLNGGKLVVPESEKEAMAVLWELE
jgi:hypothetical protein